jgi:hypothetical protein
VCFGLFILLLDLSGEQPIHIFRSRDAWVFLVLPGALLVFRIAVLAAALAKRWVRHPVLIALYLPWAAGQAVLMYEAARSYMAALQQPGPWR